MSEPKKETVRIVLPPRREGQALPTTPRETAMINLPPKPVPAAPSAPAAPPSAPAPPAGLQPPSAPSIPKPPSFPSAPKPPAAPMSAPSVPPSAPGVPKPPSVPPTPTTPGLAPKPAPSAIGPAPVAVKPQAKKETAKIGSGIAVKPQATVRLQPRPQPTQTASASFKIQPSAAVIPAAETTEEEIPMNLAIAALATAIIALVFQVWMMIS